MQYNAGDVIRYRTFCDNIRTVLVQTSHANIKNGRPGFDGVTMPGSHPVWGYDSQIVEVYDREDPNDPSLFLSKQESYV